MIANRQPSRKPLDSDLCSLVIIGEPASKANSRRLVSIKGRMVPIKSKKALAYSKDFNNQCPVLENLYEGDLAIAMKIFYQSKKPDLDESLVLDLLQGKVYKNDRAVKMKHIEWGLDREYPRSLIVLGPLEKQKEVVSTLRELVVKDLDNTK